MKGQSTLEYVLIVLAVTIALYACNKRGYQKSPQKVAYHTRGLGR